MMKITTIISAVILGCISTSAPAQSPAVDDCSVYFIPSSDNRCQNLYKDFDNKTTHATGTLPDTFMINLSGFTFPLEANYKVSSRYGRRWGRKHKGIDLAAKHGSTVLVSFDGIVRKVGYERKGYGNYVIVRHSNGLETYYAHLSKTNVHPNQKIASGHVIGWVGSTGRSTGSHLHYETRIAGHELNPELLVDFASGCPTCSVFVFRKAIHC